MCVAEVQLKRVPGAPKSPDRHTLLVQQVASRRPHLDAPILASIHRLTAVSAISVRRVGLNWQTGRFSQRVSPVPSMDDNCIARRPDPRVKNEWAGGDRFTGRIASPVAAGGKAPA